MMGCGASQTSPAVVNRPRQPDSLPNSGSDSLEQVVLHSSSPHSVVVDTVYHNSSTNDDQVRVNNNQQSSPGGRTSPPRNGIQSPMNDEHQDAAARMSGDRSIKSNDYNNDQLQSFNEVTSAKSPSPKYASPTLLPFARTKNSSPSPLPSGSHRHSNAKSSELLPGPRGRCTRCPHCRGVPNRNSPAPIPIWMKGHPGSNGYHIDMDKFDNDAVKEKAVDNNGHIPGAYDYQPHLTIEDIDDYLSLQKNYMTLPVIAKTKPTVAPASTPYPDYALLQSRDQRLNKPYSQTLFDDE